MPFDIQKYESILNDTSTLLTCMDSISPSMSPAEINQVRHSNHCLQWLYETHLKGKYSYSEVNSVLCLVKTLLIPRLQSLSDPHSLSYGDMSALLRGVLSRFKWFPHPC